MSAFSRATLDTGELFNGPTLRSSVPASARWTMTGEVTADLGDPVRALLNIITIGLWLLAVVDVIRSPREDWYNPRGKVLTVLLVAGPSPVIRGVFVPIGPLVWFLWWRSAGGLGHYPSARRPGRTGPATNPRQRANLNS